MLQDGLKKLETTEKKKKREKQKSKKKKDICTLYFCVFFFLP